MLQPYAGGLTGTPSAPTRRSGHFASHSDLQCPQCGAGVAGSLAGDTAPMGFNPFRPRRTRPTDVVFVAAGLLLTLALLLWAAGVV